MDNKIIFELPEEAILERSKHLRDAMRIGQKGGSVYILTGGSTSTRKDIAGAIAYGCIHPEQKISVKEEKVFRGEGTETITDKMTLEMEKIQQELDDLLLLDLPGATSEYNRSSPYPEKSERIELIVDEMQEVIEEKELYKNVSPLKNIDQAIYYRRDETGYYIGGMVTTEIEDKAYKEIKKVLDTKQSEKLVFLAIDGLSENKINSLQFDYDAELVKVTEPDMTYYKQMFEYLLQEQGWELGEKESIEDVICGIRRLRPQNFCVADLEKAITKAIKKAKQQERLKLEQEDFNFLKKKYEDPEKLLQETIGLEKVKHKVMRMAKLNEFNLRRFGLAYQHASYSLAFAGDPGVGKSMVAKLYAQILAKVGITNGIFVCANKSDYVGEFQGWTVKKMRTLFENARGGVIFFDEAATFLTNDSYTSDARTELVRFMELYPDVVCIFASYEENISQLLEKDPGLRSRIAEVIVFENYSDDELYEILEKFCQKEQFELQDARKEFFDYVAEERCRNPKSFGNARLCRNVFEKAKEILATETLQQKLDPREVDTIRSEIIRQAVEELRENSTRSNKEHKLGFCAA